MGIGCGLSALVIVVLCNRMITKGYLYITHAIIPFRFKVGHWSSSLQYGKCFSGPVFIYMKLELRKLAGKFVFFRE